MAILAEQRGLLAETQSSESRKPLRTPRRTYEDNFDFAFSFYQPMLDYMDKKLTADFPFDRKELPHLPYVDERCLLEPLRLRNTPNKKICKEEHANSSRSILSPALVQRVQREAHRSLEEENKSSKLKDMIEASEGRERGRKVLQQQQQLLRRSGGNSFASSSAGNPDLSFSSSRAIEKSTLGADGGMSRVKLGVSNSMSSSSVLAHFSPNVSDCSKTFSVTKTRTKTVDEPLDKSLNRKLAATSTNSGSTSIKFGDSQNKTTYHTENSERNQNGFSPLSKSKSIAAVTCNKTTQDRMKAISDKYNNIMHKDPVGKIETSSSFSRKNSSFSDFGRFHNNIKMNESVCNNDENDDFKTGMSRFRGTRKTVHFLPSRPPPRVGILDRNKGINMQSEDAEYWKGLW